MDEWLASALATFITAPLLLFLLVYVGARLFGRRKRSSFYAAVNAATVFFIAAVYFLLAVVFHRSYLVPLLLFLFVLHALIALGYWRKQGDFRLRAVFRLFWRASFLIFASLYAGLMVYGIVVRIAASL
ncbi:DUF3397 domain-containing protein [Geobacillus icigianus]|uniref:DUF3397 domain-containing protein n=1 Tax=Geobacillus subterraneus TaxID=129338 RepID=A0A679FVL9_9BACL|nr:MULTISPECIES: DUF3397 domain-containing protein [Geobacillus]KYD23623.1 hypothetical protein B4113_2988 [Geobacillus sp. B4113_201601]BBW96804.1 hypothetical protein GsuE55_16370 [Geobacillus subterraneus]